MDGSLLDESDLEALPPLPPLLLLPPLREVVSILNIQSANNCQILPGYDSFVL